MLRIKECKALARRTLLGRYGIVIAAYFITIAIKVLMWVLTAMSAGMTLLNAGVFGGMLGTGIAFSFPKLVGGVMLTMFLLVVTIIVSLWFEIGSTKLMLNICRGLKGSVGDVFYGFKEGSNTLIFILTGVVLGFITFVINVVQKLLYALAGHVLANQTGAHIAAVVFITVISLLVMWYVATAFMFAKIIIADKRESTIGGALKASRRLMKGRKLKGFWLIYFSFLFWYILMFICGPAALWISPYIVCTTVIFYMDADGTLWQLPGEDNAAQGTPAADEANSQDDAAVSDDNELQAATDNAEETQDIAADDMNSQDDVTAGDENAQQAATDNAEETQDIAVNEENTQQAASASDETVAAEGEESTQTVETGEEKLQQETTVSTEEAQEVIEPEESVQPDAEMSEGKDDTQAESFAEENTPADTAEAAEDGSTEGKADS